jgi:hypothetical protein
MLHLENNSSICKKGNEEITKLLSLLYESKKAYRKYLANGGIFVFTKQIRKINQEILDLLQSLNLNYYPTLISGLVSLIEHLEGWLYLWDENKNTQNPDDKDVFSFTGYQTYPKNLEQLLILYLNERID